MPAATEDRKIKRDFPRVGNGRYDDHGSRDPLPRRLRVRAVGTWRPKSHAERGVPINARLLVELERIKPEKLQGWAFTSSRGPDGRWAVPAKEVRTAFADTGLTNPKLKVGCHALRRFWASTLLARGAPIESVRKMGGWSTAQILLDHYVLTTSERREAVELVG